MGSFFSVPKSPRVAQQAPVVFEPVTTVQQPVVAQQPPSASQQPSVPVSQPPAAEDSGASDAGTDTTPQRESTGLLNRRRGIAQTITSSFRGVLRPGNFQPTRKTLLGE